MVVSFAHGAVQLDSSVVELSFKFPHVLQGGFLGGPAFLQRFKLRALGFQIFPKLCEARLRRVILLFLECQFLNAHPVNDPSKLIDFYGGGFNLHLQATRCLVNQIDGFIGKLPCCDVSIGERGSRNQSTVSDHNLVVSLIALLQTSKNRHGVFDARFTHKNLLESALESGIFFDVFAIFVEGCRADEAELAARQHGLEHVGSRDRSFATTSTHQSVQLIHEGDDFALSVVDFFEHGFEPFFKLSAVLCPGNDRR